MAPVRVMLVDDSPQMLRSLQSLLKRMPELTVVAVAPDGVEALSLIQATEPQLMILDINMPKMNGLELLDELRKMNSPVEVIVLSAYADAILQQDAIARGAIAFVSKGNVALFLKILQGVVGNLASI